MHDISELERRGVPAVCVASAEFASAAATQAEALGFEVAAVFTEHPIQDRTDAEMAAIADAVFESLVEALTAPG